METRVTEVADGIHQLTTVVPDAPVVFNQYLIAAEEPLLFHTGMRGLFPLVSAGVERVLPASSVRWVSFGHVEADECGSMNEWLALAPQATVAQSQIGCMVSLEDLADRPPRTTSWAPPSRPRTWRPARSPSTPPAPPRCDGWPSSRSRPWPSCTAPPSTVTAARRCWT